MGPRLVNSLTKTLKGSSSESEETTHLITPPTHCWGGGGTQQVLLIPCLTEKATPLSYNFNDKWYLFLIPSLHLCILFDRVIALSFEHKIKKKNRKPERFLDFFHSHKIQLLTLWCPFTDPRPEEGTRSFLAEPHRIGYRPLWGVTPPAPILI